MQAIQKTRSLSHLLQEARKFARCAVDDIARTILTAPKNPQSAQYLLLSMVAIIPLFNLAHLAFLKYHQTSNSEGKERTIVSFCNKLAYTAKVISIIFFTLIPLSLYLGITQGIAAIQNRNFINLVKAIRNVSGTIGFFVPLSKIFFQLTPTSIAQELYIQFHNFKMPKEYEKIHLIEEPCHDVKSKEPKRLGLSPALAKIREEKITDESLRQYLRLPEGCTSEDSITSALASKGLISIQDLQDHEILNKDEPQLFQDRLEQYLNIFQEEDAIISSSAYEFLTNSIPFLIDSWKKICAALGCEQTPEAIATTMHNKGLRTIQDLFTHKILTNASRNNTPQAILAKLLKYLSQNHKYSRILPFITLLSGAHLFYTSPLITICGIFFSFRKVASSLQDASRPQALIYVLSLPSCYFSNYLYLLIHSHIGFIHAVITQLRLQLTIRSIFKRISFHFEDNSQKISQLILICQQLYVEASQILLLHLRINHFFMSIKMGLAFRSLWTFYSEERKSGS